MAKLTEFLKNISVTAGFINDDFSHAILANPELEKIELPDDFVTNFHKKFLTEEEAKSNHIIKAHYTRAALDPLDNSLESLMSEMEFSEEDKAEINKEKSTYKKNELMMKKLKTMSSKSTSEEDKQKFNKEIQRLNSELAKKDTEKESALRETNNNWVTKLSNQTLTSKIKSQPLYTTDTLDIEDVTTIAHNKLEKALQEKKLVKVFDPESLTYKLVQKENPDLAHFENGKEITFDAFLQNTLANAKLLKTTTTAQTDNGGSKTKFTTVTRTDNGDKVNPLRNRIKNSIEEDLANFTQANS